jgi:hypothetical protein
MEADRPSDTLVSINKVHGTTFKNTVSLKYVCLWRLIIQNLIRMTLLSNVWYQDTHDHS